MSLALTLGDVRDELTRFIGRGRDFGALDHDAREDIDSFIRRGLRQFLNPPPLPQEMTGHVWSFLRPFHDLTTVAGQQAYDLPDDFGSLTSDLVFATEDSQTPVRYLNDPEWVRHESTNPDRTGRPAVAVVRARPDDQGATDTPLRYLVRLWPTPDAVYTLRFQYYALHAFPASSTSEMPGGAQHSETVLMSCLAIAEEYGETPSTRYRELFIQRLAASVSHDRSRGRSSFIGRMSDGSDRYDSRVIRRTDGYNVTVNGTLP